MTPDALSMARLRPLYAPALALLVIAVGAQTGVGQTNLCKAILARKSVKLSGNILVDSFNSMEPLHSTNGRYDPTKREDGGDVASVSDTVTVITDTGNTSVYGHFATGPSGSVSISGNASVGSLAWVNGGNRGIQPGWYYTNFQATVTDASLPNVSFSTLRQTSGVVNGTNYSYVLTTGNYKSSSSFSLTTSMCINGNVVLYFQSGFQVSGSGFIYIAPGAKLTVYLASSSTISGRGTINGTGNATNCTFYGLPTCTSLQNSGSSDFVGVVYAPEAAVTLSGGGSQTVNFAGSVVAYSVTVSGGYQFHFDQALCGGCVGPVIVTPPSDQISCPGTTASFSVTATGGNLLYQWYKAGAVLNGQTNSSLTLNSVGTADVATYSVVVSVPCGRAVTNSATLTVRTLVSTSPLTNLVRFVGSTAIFSTTASGTGPFAYSWQKNGVVIPGQTGSTLTLTNLAVNDSGTYSVIVSGPCNSVTNTATLTVDSCFPSVDVMLVIDRSGSMTGKPYADARQACSNFVQNLHFTNNGDLAGLASYNSTATLDRMLTNSLIALDQAIAALPGAGGNTSISLGLQTGQTELASSRHRLTALPVLVLLSDGLPTGTDTPSNALYVATQAKNAGTRIFTVGLGAVDPSLMSGIASSPSDFFYTTNSSDLTALFNAISTIICRPPTNIVALGPSNQTVCAGSPVTFSVSASGCDSFSYQWEKNGVRILGQTSSALNLSNVQAADAGLYSVEIINACRTVTNSATLTVNQPVLVTAPPQSLTNCPGTIARFEVTATGTALVYQWFKNGNPLTSETTSSLTLTNVGPSDIATYTVVVSGACGASITNTASLTVTALPVISCAGNKTVQLGTPWTFDPPSANYPVSIVGTVTNTASHCGNTFDATRTWIATDACGNVSAPCSQTVTVIDTIAPTLDCTASTNKTVQIGTPWAFDPPTATDNGGTNVTISIVGTVTNTTSHCGNTFDATRTWVATDACGNVSAPCSQTVTVIDTIAPTLDCSNSTNKTVQIGTPWTFDPPTATDNSGTNITISIVGTVTNTASHCGNTFDATRTWVATDACGNVSAPCSQTVTVIDTIAPTLDCTASTNKTVQIGTPWTFDPPTATDNGGTNITISIVNTVTNTTSHCGNTFDATRTWVATDACGNVSAPCSQTVTVIDTIAPTLDCSNSTNKTVQIGTPWTFDPPTASDNGGTNVTISIVGTVTNTASHCGNTFDATRTWVATDACGNVSAPCSQTVTVIDTTAPTLNCSSSTNKTVQIGTPWTFGPPTATDNGGTNITISVLGTVTNFTGHCGNGFDATRTWVATDACGNVSAPCSQTVTVIDSTPIHITVAPANQTNCPSDTVTFSITAEGSALTYAWSHNGVLAGTNSTLTLTNVSSADAGSYSVVVSDTCGDSITNSASLILNSSTTISPLASVTNNLGTGVTFSTVASGTGPFTYVWKKNGTTIPGVTGSSLTLTNLGYADAAIYRVEVTGKCNTASSEAVLTINVPPTVAIISPTNGSVFIAPATFALAANALDVDGIVTNVEFFRFGTNKLGETTNSAPGLIFLTNLTVGTYSFTATATDNLGARGTSAPVTVSVIAEPPLTIISAIHLDLQTGLFIQTVRVFNPTFSSADAARVYITNLNPSTTVHNASGVTNGVPYVQSHGPVPAGGYVDLTIEYADPFRILPNPTLHAALVVPEQGGGPAVSGIPQHIDRGIMLGDKTFLVEFLTVTNRLYYIEYSSDLKTWKTAQPAVTGTGTRIQWIDNGQPKTESAPSIQPVRFYRVVLLP